MSEIKVCIGCYASYNAGYLIDRWVHLPMPDDELDAILKDMGREAQHLAGDLCPAEEFYVSDYDGIPFGMSYGNVFGEYTSLHALNVLARLMELYPRECEVVEAAIDTGCDCPSSVLELMNWVVQADDIPYYSYDAPSWCTKPEEKYAASYVLSSPWWEQLCAHDVEQYFDLEAYGEAMAQYAHLGEDGYVDACQDMPDEDRYDLAEIQKMLG